MDRDVHAKKGAGRSGIGAVKRNGLSGIACHRDTNEIAVADNAVGGIELHPARTRQISPHPRMGRAAADMAVAMVLAFGCAAAGSRLLWPVILIAAYYAAGVLLTGTSPMVALIGQVPEGSGSSRPPLGRVDQLERVDADDVDSMLGHSPRTIS